MEPLATVVQGAESAARTAELAEKQAREQALQQSSVMKHTAEALDDSATLAEEHAHRRGQAGDQVAAAKERGAAARARKAADHARAYATQWQPPE